MAFYHFTIGYITYLTKDLLTFNDNILYNNLYIYIKIIKLFLISIFYILFYNKNLIIFPYSLEPINRQQLNKNKKNIYLYFYYIQIYYIDKYLNK